MSFKSFVKAQLYKCFAIAQRLGVDVLPRHFYSQIPDIRALKAKQTWRKPMSMFAVRGADVLQQGQCFSSWMQRGQLADASLQAAVYGNACQQNGAPGYGPIEAEIWFRMMVALQPKRVIQIGAGVSTAVALAAMRASPFRCELIAIDPFPTRYLTELASNGEINLRREPAQETPIALFESLKCGDVLFIDSTHTVTPGSEVNYLILEVLARLAPGVIVHFHDIYFPYDYQRHLLNGELFFQSESTLLHAFLCANTQFTIEFALSALHYADPSRIQQFAPSYRAEGNEAGLSAGPNAHFPSAVYLRVLDTGKTASESSEA